MEKSSYYHLLETFALMAELEIGNKSDQWALKELQRLLNLENPWVLIQKDGPMFFALAKKFGLVRPFTGAERMDALNPEPVCKMLASWEKFRLSVLELDEAQSFVENLNARFADSKPAI